MSEREIAEIPADIWNVAQDVCHDVEDACVDLYEGADPKHNPAVLIARAILAEREACVRRYRDGAGPNSYDYFEEAENAINPKH